MKTYVEQRQTEGYFCGRELIEEAAKVATLLYPDLTKEEILFLSKEVDKLNESYDGEPTSAKSHARQIKELAERKKKKGIPLTTEFTL